MIEVSTFYSALLLALAVFLELFVRISDMFKAQDTDKEISEKNKKFSSIPFVCLMAMGAIVLLISTIFNIVNFRLAWIVNEINGKYELSFQFLEISNQWYVMADTLFILFVFYAMIKYIKQVKYRKYQYTQEGFYINGKSNFDILFVPYVYIFILLIPIFFGVSLILIALSWIPSGAIAYVFLKNRLG